MTNDDLWRVNARLASLLPWSKDHLVENTKITAAFQSVLADRRGEAKIPSLSYWEDWWKHFIDREGHR